MSSVFGAALESELAAERAAVLTPAPEAPTTADDSDSAVSEEQSLAKAASSEQPAAVQQVEPKPQATEPPAQTTSPTAEVASEAVASPEAAAPNAAPAAELAEEGSAAALASDTQADNGPSTKPGARATGAEAAVQQPGGSMFEGLDLAAPSGFDEPLSSAAEDDGRLVSVEQQVPEADSRTAADWSRRNHSLETLSFEQRIENDMHLRAAHHHHQLGTSDAVVRRGTLNNMAGN